MRRLAVVLPLLLIATVLTGCVTNLPVAAVDWLAGRDGVVDARILADETGAWSSGGLVRGELEPGIGDEGIVRLIDEIQGYSASNGGVSFWLGWDEVDFSVGPDDTENEDVIALWHDLVSAPGIASGVVLPGEVKARALRTDAQRAFDALTSLDAGMRLEAFADGKALAADVIADYSFDAVNPLAIEYRQPTGCTPDAAVRTFVDDLLARDDIPGATADLCAGITIDIARGDSVAAQALAFRGDLDRRGLAGFPVQLTSEVDGHALDGHALDGQALDGQGPVHFAAITPGDAGLLPVLAVFEQAGAPVVSYSLGPDGTLAVTAYDVPTADLLALVQGSPMASGLAGIGLEGDPVAILAPLDRLPGLLDEALALDAASGTFGSVQLGVGFGMVTLESGAGADPDVTVAAEALRASGAADGRFFSVRHLNFQADIANGVAALTDPDYRGADVMVAFVEAWNR